VLLNATCWNSSPRQHSSGALEVAESSLVPVCHVVQVSPEQAQQNARFRQQQQQQGAVVAPEQNATGVWASLTRLQYLDLSSNELTGG
jgi:hypothetical protein